MVEELFITIAAVLIDVDAAVIIVEIERGDIGLAVDPLRSLARQEQRNGGFVENFARHRVANDRALRSDHGRYNAQLGNMFAHIIQGASGGNRDRNARRLNGGDSRCHTLADWCVTIEVEDRPIQI